MSRCISCGTSFLETSISFGKCNICRYKSYRMYGQTVSEIVIEVAKQAYSEKIENENANSIPDDVRKSNSRWY